MQLRIRPVAAEHLDGRAGHVHAVVGLRPVQLEVTAGQVGGEAAKTVRSVSQTLAAQVGSAAGGVADAGSDLASSATAHAKTFASELEAMARRNPLGTIAGALLVGVIVGMMSRGRG